MGTSLKGRDPPGHFVGARNEGCCTGIKSEAELGNLQTTPAGSNNKEKLRRVAEFINVKPVYHSLFSYTVHMKFLASICLFIYERTMFKNIREDASCTKRNDWSSQ